MWTRASIILAIALSLVKISAAEPKKSEASENFFRATNIHTLRIEVPSAKLAALKQGNREYVRAILHDGDVTLRDVGIRLKGHGTFQPLDKKPAFAVKANEYVTGQDLHGLNKFVLNNCVTDASYARELLAAELFRQAGLPAARGTHVRVEFNGRDLGFYVLMEAANKSFLKRELGNGNGNLYEGETRDIDQKLEQENGEDESQSDLKALVAAARAPVGERLARLGAVLDVDAFTSFLAMEMLTANIDGYAFNRNNYRIFHHPKSDRLMFLPHGLDATFGSASFKPPTNSIMVNALWSLPGFQKQYQARLGELAEKVWQVESITNRLNSIMTRLATASPALAEPLEKEAKRLRYQIEQQQRFIEAEFKRRRPD